MTKREIREWTKQYWASMIKMCETPDCLTTEEEWKIFHDECSKIAARMGLHTKFGFLKQD